MKAEYYGEVIQSTKDSSVAEISGMEKYKICYRVPFHCEIGDTLKLTFETIKKLP